MKAHNVACAKDSCLEGIHFTQDETTEALLKHRIWLLKLQGATQQQTQQSLALHRKVLEEGSSNFERYTIPQRSI